MIERLYYLLLMSGGKMIRRIRAAPSTLLSVIGRLTRGAVSAMESITQTRVSVKGELVSQEYRYTAVAKMQIHAMAIATTAMEKLKGAVKTILTATAIATTVVGNLKGVAKTALIATAIATTTVEKLKGAAKTVLTAVAVATRAELRAISGQSNDDFSGRGSVTPLWIEKLEAVTTSVFHAVGIATADSFVIAAGRSIAAFAANTVATLISVVTVPGYLQMAAVAIGNLAHVNAPVSAAAFVATTAIGVLNSHSTTTLTGKAYARILARGMLLNNTKILHGDGNTMADANGQTHLLTGRMAASRTSTTVSAQGVADAHATRRGRIDTEVSAIGQAVVASTKRGRTDTEVSVTGQAVIDATKQGRVGTFVSTIAAAVRVETNRSRPETVVSATADTAIAQNTASDTKIAVIAYGHLAAAIIRYVSTMAGMTAETVGNAMTTIRQLAGRAATSVLSVGHLMMQNFRGQTSTIGSAAGQITLLQGQRVDGKTKTKASAVGSLTAMEARALQGGVKALIAAVASAITSGTQRAFTSVMLSAQGIGTVLTGAIRGTAGTVLSVWGIGTILSGAIRSIAGTMLSAQGAGTVLSETIRGTANTGISATAGATLAAASRGAAQSVFFATATAAYQVLLLRGSTSMAGSAIGSTSINTWLDPKLTLIPDDGTYDLYIQQVYSVNQNGSRLTIT